MKFLKTYFLIIVGGIILFTASTESLGSPYLYIVGIVFLMVGLFNISKTVRSKDKIENDNFIEEEE